MGIFHTYDVRGKYPEELNEENSYLIGRAFASLFPGTVVVGSDSRLSTPSLKENLIKGLMDSGATAIDIGMAPTPVVYFSCYFLKLGTGIMVTGSHIPKDNNGMKFCNQQGIPINEEAGLSEIEELTQTKKFKRGIGKLEQRNVDKDYIDFIKSLCKTNFEGIKIVLDGSNGVAGKIYSQILKDLGTDVIEIFTEPDGNFPGHEPDPMKIENLQPLIDKVKETNADVGIGVDGDGDRINFVNEKGELTNSNEIFALLAEIVLKEHQGGKIIHDVLTSKMLIDVVKENNGIPIVSRVGHTIIARKCFEVEALMAGEVSGHYFFKEANYTDDVAVAAVKILSTLSQNKIQISELLKKYPKYFGENLRVEIKPEKKFEFIEDLKKRFSEKNYKTTFLDGVRVDFDHGWILFRPSNTEPKISIGLESSSPEGFKELKSFVESIIKEIPR